MPSKHQRRVPIFSYYSEESPEAIEFQRTYSRIKNVLPNAEIRNLVITSATMAEGKSTTSSFLAITVSKLQQSKTLLVDFDLRNPKIHQIFDLERKHGVGDILEGKLSAKSCFKDTPFANLKVLTAGSISEPAVNVLTPHRIKRFFDEIRFYYQTIIVDTAPVIAVSDALVLSTETDGILLVVRAGKTPRDVAKRACDLIRDAGSKIWGVIVNDIEDVLPFYYKYDYYA